MVAQKNSAGRPYSSVDNMSESAQGVYLENILKGRFTSSGKGSRTIYSGGEKFNVHSHEGRRKAYISVCKEKGIAVNYRLLADSIVENKYLARHGKQDDVLDYVVSAGIDDNGEDSWKDYFSGSKMREVVGSGPSGKSLVDEIMSGDIKSAYSVGGKVYVLDSQNVSSGVSNLEEEVSVPGIMLGKKVLDSVSRKSFGRMARAGVFALATVAATLIPSYSANSNGTEVPCHTETEYRVNVRGDIVKIKDNVVTNKTEVETVIKVGPTNVRVSNYSDNPADSIDEVSPSSGTEEDVSAVPSVVAKDNVCDKNRNRPAIEGDNGRSIYTVKKGDEMKKIAKEQNLNYESFRAENEYIVDNENCIFPGDTLYLPSFGASFVSDVPTVIDKSGDVSTNVSRGIEEKVIDKSGGDRSGGVIEEDLVVGNYDKVTSEPADSVPDAGNRFKEDDREFFTVERYGIPFIMKRDKSNSGSSSSDVGDNYNVSPDTDTDVSNTKFSGDFVELLREQGEVYPNHYGNALENTGLVAIKDSGRNVLNALDNVFGDGADRTYVDKDSGEVRVYKNDTHTLLDGLLGRDMTFSEKDSEATKNMKKPFKYIGGVVSGLFSSVLNGAGELAAGANNLIIKGAVGGVLVDGTEAVTGRNLATVGLDKGISYLSDGVHVVTSTVAEHFVGGNEFMKLPESIGNGIRSGGESWGVEYKPESLESIVDPQNYSDEEYQELVDSAENPEKKDTATRNIFRPTAAVVTNLIGFGGSGSSGAETTAGTTREVVVGDSGDWTNVGN